MRKLRNILTHEYPQKEEEVVKTLNKMKNFIVDLYQLIFQLSEGFKKFKN